AAPMGGPRRLAVEGGLDYGLDLLRRDGRLAAAALLDLGQGLGPIAGEALSPEQDGGTTDAQGFGDGPVGDPIRCHQDHARPQSHTLGGAGSAPPAFEDPALVFSDEQRGCRLPHVGTYWRPPPIVNLFLGRYSRRRVRPCGLSPTERVTTSSAARCP